MNEFEPGWYVVEGGCSGISHLYEQLLYGRQWAHARCAVVNLVRRLDQPQNTDVKCDQCEKITIH